MGEWRVDNFAYHLAFTARLWICQAGTFIEVNGFDLERFKSRVSWDNSWVGYDFHCLLLVFYILHQMVQF